jgi:hypothetical protein
MSFNNSLSEVTSSYPSLYKNNLEVNPLFVDAGAHNFALQSDSPMIDSGAFLTNTTSAGNGTSMQVRDASYFYDGFEIEGEVGDLIQLDGQTTTARIVSIDYAANTLTLDTSLTWTNGQGVSLAYSGNAPDIGAYEHEGGFGSSSVFSAFLNWIKGLLTTKTANAILTGKTINGNAVNETNENGNSKVLCFILSLLAVIILIIVIIIVKAKGDKKKKRFRKN